MTVILPGFSEQLLSEMTDAQLQKVGISSFGHRHFILKRVQTLMGNMSAHRGETSSTSSASGPQGGGSMLSSNHWTQSSTPSHRTNMDMHVRTAEEPGRALFSKPAVPRQHHPTPRIHESQVT